MSEYENNFYYPIPANYTDSGRLFGGLCEVRNTIEAVILVLLVGYPQLAWLHFSLPLKVVTMTITLLPIGVFSLIGISGESLFQYMMHMISYKKAKRILHFERVGAIEIQQATNNKPKKAKKQRKRTKLVGNQKNTKRNH